MAVNAGAEQKAVAQQQGVSEGRVSQIVNPTALLRRIQPAARRMGLSDTDLSALFARRVEPGHEAQGASRTESYLGAGDRTGEEPRREPENSGLTVVKSVGSGSSNIFTPGTFRQRAVSAVADLYAKLKSEGAPREQLREAEALASEVSTAPAARVAQIVAQVRDQVSSREANRKFNASLDSEPVAAQRLAEDLHSEPEPHLGEKARQEWDEMRADEDPPFDHLPDHIQEEWEHAVDHGDHSGYLQGKLLDKLEIGHDTGADSAARTQARHEHLAKMADAEDTAATDSARAGGPHDAAVAERLKDGNFRKALEAVRDSTRLPEFLRTLADKLLKQEVEARVRVADDLAPGTHGQYDNVSGDIRLAHAEDAGTFLHEAVHAAVNSLWLKRAAGERVSAAAEAAMRDIEGVRRTAQRALMGLANRLRDGYLSDGVTKREAMQRGIEDARHILSSGRELSAYAATHAGVREWLQARRSGPQSWFSRIADAWRRMLGVEKTGTSDFERLVSGVDTLVRESDGKPFGEGAADAMRGEASPPARVNRALRDWAQDALTRRPRDPDVQLFRTLPILQKLGIYRPVTINFEHARHIQNTHPEVTPELIGALPDLLQRPRAVSFDDGSWRFIVDARDAQGKPYEVALRNDNQVRGRETLKVTEIKTAFGMEDSAFRLTELLRGGKVLYMPEKEAARIESLAKGTSVEGLRGEPSLDSSRRELQSQRSKPDAGRREAPTDTPSSPAGADRNARASSAKSASVGQEVTVQTEKGAVKLELPPRGTVDLSGVDFARSAERDFRTRLHEELRRNPSLRQTDSLVGRYVKEQLRKGLMFVEFGHDLTRTLKDTLPSAGKYWEAVQGKIRERTRREEQIAGIARRFYDLPAEVRDRANALIRQSTMEQKWAYAPEWDAKAPVDLKLSTEFARLPEEAQNIVKDVFAHGRREIYDRERAINKQIVGDLTRQMNDAIAHADKTKAVELRREIDRTIREEGQVLTKMQGPYAPLKRFGDHAVVAKSREYMDAEAANDIKRLEALEKDENHYYVEFTDGKFYALKRADTLRQAHPDYADVYATERMVESRRNDELPYQTISRMKEAIGEQFKNDKALQRHLDQMASELYVGSLNAMNARKSELKRRNIAGADADMMRAFVSQGRANASLIASLESHEAVRDSLQGMKEESKTGDRLKKSAALNEVLKRHLALLDARESPFQDKVMAATSVGMLLTRAMYFINNATQPFVLSVPRMIGAHGAGRTWREMVPAYAETLDVMRQHAGRSIDIDAVGRLERNVGRERDMAQTLLDRGHMDIGMDTDLGQITHHGEGLSKTMSGVLRRLRGMSNAVETANRLSTALTAYRLEYANERKSGLNESAAHERATEYADDIILATHGDYSAANAPRLLMQGNYAHLPVKTMGQFRKYQLIQVSLLARAGYEAFAGASAAERAVGRKTLGWIMATQGVLTGLMGMPLVAPAAAILTAIFKDHKEEDSEAYLRRQIGDPDLSQLLLHGVPAAMGADASRGLGMDNILSPLPYADKGKNLQEQSKNWIVSAVGPAVSLGMRAMQGMDQIAEGRYWEGAEKLLPTGVAALSKAARYATQGVTNARGDALVKADDVRAIDAMMQGVGLPTTKLTDRVWRSSTLHEEQQRFAEETADLKRQYIDAAKDKDGERMRELREEWNRMQSARAELGYGRKSVSDLVLAPVAQAKRERNTVGGVEFTPENRQAATRLSRL